jgi:Domain of unknown function (DUF6798)
MTKTARIDVLSVAIGAIILGVFLGFLGVSADNTDYLLGAYERSDPGFLAKDWFVQNTESFHPFFEIYMAWWLKLDQLVPGLFLWYALNLLWLSAVVLMLIKYLGLGGRFPLAMVLATGLLLVGVRQGWGQYEIITGQALPAYLAYPPALMSVVLLFQRRFFMSALALVITFLIHHGLGALMLLALVGPFLAGLPRTRRELINIALGAGLVAATFLIVVIRTFERDAGQAADLSILFYGRAPQHYAIQFFQTSTNLATLQIFASAILLAFTIRNKDIRLKVLSFVATVGVLSLLGYVLLEIWYVPTFIRMFPYRAIPLLVVFNASLITVLLMQGTTARREIGVVVLVAASSILFQYNMVVSLILLIGAVVLRCVRMQIEARPHETRAALVFVAAIGALSLVYSAFARPPVFFKQWPPAILITLKDVFREFTSEDDVVVVPPWLTGVRISTNRAIVVNMKNFPMYGPEMVEWADRMLDISGVDPRLAKQYLAQGANIWQMYNQGYQARSMENLLMAAKKYGARFILVSTGSRFHFEATRSAMPVVWSENGYALYEFAEGA